MNSRNLSAMLRIFLTIAAMAPALLAGCAAHLPPAPTAMAADAARPVQEYRIQPGDQLDVKFYFSPELNEQVTVRPDGRISLQLVRDVEVAGSTPNEVTERLTELFKKSLLQPEIAVIVRTFAAYRVFVDGEVNKAGVIPLAGNMTISQAISEAGGMRETASPSSVVLVRRVPSGKPIVAAVDVTRIFDGTDPAQDVQLQPSDIVFVPRSTIANLNLFVDQYLRKLIPIPVYVGIPLNL